jgi:hypothetical protein
MRALDRIHAVNTGKEHPPRQLELKHKSRNTGKKTA